MNKIYIAGPYSGDTLSTFKNMRSGITKATELLAKGFAPFCPWLDFMFCIVSPEEFKVEDFYNYSLEWMSVSDAVLLLPGWEKSKGTLKEIEIAEKIGIPVFLPEEEEAMYEFFKLPGMQKPLEQLLKESEEAEVV